jgi:Fur family peroxide stress response transcriptional regulator
MTQTFKRSHQREAIITYLCSRKDHPTADQIYTALREEMPSLSLGTVYRNLALLAETGQILKLSCDGRMDRYDADIRPHYHVLCTECGAVEDLLLAYDHKLDENAAASYGGTIQNHMVIFYGTCTACSQKKLPPK